MEKREIQLVIEAVIFTSNTPVSLEKIMSIFPEDENRPTEEEFREILADMANHYEERSFELKQVASGYCFQTRSQYSPWIIQMLEERPQRYSRATLETLAIIAYRQPVTRPEIEDIRGVAVSTSIFKTLLDRNWIQQIGHRDLPGKPAVYGTTKEFLDYFNLKSIDELPTLPAVSEIVPNLDRSEMTLDINEIVSTALPERDEEHEKALMESLVEAFVKADAVNASFIESKEAVEEEVVA